MYNSRLTEINKTELRSQDEYKYTVAAFDDITEIKYFERNNDNGELELKNTFDIPSYHDIQICEKIIELRKAYGE